ncbi:hypothetical protein GOBAR_AA20723 [Gossypium barbadense]|uniref:Uncharacterized protein n=1 Tax=Gossypium barbadense TaxID=3634 RepID=A0A2P5X9C5_GOSBA|nr:hypothetical protein GOBAR_AA20723 [Gossypium barbadense]
MYDFWELTLVMGFVLGYIGVYLTMPPSDYSFLKLPRSLEDLHILSPYFHVNFHDTGDYFHVIARRSVARSLQGVVLVVFTATAGASSCYFLLTVIGRPLVFSLWPDKGTTIELYAFLKAYSESPTLPNTFNNVASPIVDVPYHIFLTATFIGLIPAAYITVRAGIAL